MSFSVGIIGLPNVGKSTLFKALTKNRVDIAAHPFTTIHPNVGVVAVPDERLEKIAQVIKPEKITPTIIEFVDIAGLVKDAHKGEGLGNQFLAHIRNCDAVLEVVRAFENPVVEHVTSHIDPENDIEIVETELLMKDLETLEGLFAKLEKDVKMKDKKALKKLDFLKKVKDFVSQGKLVSEIDLNKEEEKEIKEYQFLTAKPIFYIFNISREIKAPESGAKHLPSQIFTSKNLKVPSQIFTSKTWEGLTINLKDEEEISELTEAEIKELKMKSCLDQLILACYNILSLITFYTVRGEKEARAWTIQRGSKCPQAGGKVHSDFEEKFIRAEVINWQKLVEAGNWRQARELGWLKTTGKEYQVQDGDVIEFKWR